MAQGHGGARVGAGRKPKALVYKAEVTAAEGMIVDALPKLIGKLMELAMEGNVSALKYLVDRVLGRVAVLEAAPAQDTSIQYVDKDFRHDLVGHLLKTRLRKEERDRVMWEMDLEGTELEYEFEEDEEDKEKDEEIHIDGQDTQDIQDEENIEVEAADSGELKPPQNEDGSEKEDRSEGSEERQDKTIRGYLPPSGQMRHAILERLKG